MGRYDFRPSRVHQTASRLLNAQRLTVTPPWHNVVGSIPPSQILVRTLPVQHVRKPNTKASRKPSKMFKPQTMKYEEDRLRMEFFSDHPWELARPRLVLENDGKDERKMDWSTIRSPGRPLDGERQATLHGRLRFALANTAQRRSTADASHEDDVQGKSIRPSTKGILPPETAGRRREKGGERGGNGNGSVFRKDNDADWHRNGRPSV